MYRALFRLGLTVISSDSLAASVALATDRMAMAANKASRTKAHLDLVVGIVGLESYLAQINTQYSCDEARIKLK
jgi:hypothetical protein